MTIADELIKVADKAAEAADRLDVQKIKKPLEALSVVCERVHQSWSGSNIGYHAEVYCADFQTRPAGVQFSREWGLMESWPTHTPAPIWQEYDRNAVIQHIMNGAGKPNVEQLNEAINQVRATLIDLREAAISALTLGLKGNADAFLQRKLNELEELPTPTLREFQNAAVPQGAIWSRDSLALSQGAQIAPHQVVWATPLWAREIKKSLLAVQSATRAAASHLALAQGHTKVPRITGAKVAIGHGGSPSWGELQTFLEKEVHLSVQEFNSVAVAGLPTTQRLSGMLGSSALAFLVMTAEDRQADGKFHARQNVVHEIGLFQGRLGFSRAIVILEDGCEEFSNISGLGQIRFPKGKISACFDQVRAVLEREGLIEPLGRK